MEFENQLQVELEDVQEDNRLIQQQSGIAQARGYENNAAWNQLLEWGKANPAIIMNYINYPLDQEQFDRGETKLESKQPSNESQSSKFEEVANNINLQQNGCQVNEEDKQQHLRFEIGEFEDEDLDFDRDSKSAGSKEFIFEQNNEYNFGSQVGNESDFRDQEQKEGKQPIEPFFKETYNEGSEVNEQHHTEINFAHQVPQRQKRAYKKRKSMHQQTELHNLDFYSDRNIGSSFEDEYFKGGPLPKLKLGAMKTKKMSHEQPLFMSVSPSLSRVDGWLKKKKIAASQAKKDLHNTMNKEEEFQQIQHLNRNEQIAYVESRIRHYNQLKNMILKTKSKDEAINQVFKGVLQKHSERLAMTPEASANSNILVPAEKQNSAFGKALAMTPELLRMLSGKFQLFSNYEQGKYEPGYKMSLASIANQFQLSTSTISDLYNQWRSDPSFSQKILSMQNPEPLSPSIQNPPKPTVFKKQLNSPDSNITSTDKMLEMRQVFTERFRKLKSKGARLYFLDECHKEMIMGTNRVEEQTQGNEINFSLMALLGVRGRASWKVVRWLGHKYQQMNDIQQLYKNVRDDQQVGFNQVVSNNKSYLILDPAVVKSPQKVRKIEQMTNTKVLLFPQFSKQLNPLQFWFSDVKGRLRMTAKSLAELNKVLQKFSDTDFGKYLSDSDRYMSFALQKLAF